MGCTSSAQKMPTSAINSPEKNVQFITDASKEAIEEVIYKKDSSEGNEINVLPTCDTLHLVRNNKSFEEASSLRTEQGELIQRLRDNDIAQNTHTLDEHAMGEIKNEETISSLEKAVEKVVELYVTGHTPNHENISRKDEEIDDNVIQTTTCTIHGSTDKFQGESLLEQSEQAPEETASPSLSESSRATRWEALADIAAELPPSLAVDPITGQIYALSK